MDKFWNKIRWYEKRKTIRKMKIVIYSVLCALTWRPMPAAARSKTMQYCFGLVGCICQNRYVIGVVGVGNCYCGVGTSLELVDKFTYLGSSVSSTEKDIDIRLTKAWAAIDRLSIIWKSDLTDKMKRSFFQAAVLSILLYGCTTWTLTKRLEKKLDGNYTRMLRAILNKSWRQPPTRHQLYRHLPPTTKTIR